MASGETGLQASQAGYARGDVLVDARWLHEHLHDPQLRLIEVDVSAAAYDAGHIQGAVLWNIYSDLKDANYLLVDKAAIERLVTRSGITAGSTVVFYGYAPAMGLWLMRLYGHADVRILDCMRGAWKDAARPWTTDVTTPVTTRYPLPDQDDRIRADRGTVQDAIGDPTYALLDVRTKPEFRGEQFWPSGGMEPGGRAGHVPAAVHLPIDGLHDEHGSFLNTPELRQVFASIDLSDDREVIIYCTIGGRACTAWFALTHLLGAAHVRVYDGSWAEWGRMPATRIECA